MFYNFSKYNKFIKKNFKIKIKKVLNIQKKKQNTDLNS